MFRRRVSTLGLFVRDTRGNVAMIFSLCVLGIFGLSGLAIDYSRQQSMNTKLQSVADNVALSLARESRTKSAVYIQQRADELFAAALANSNITAGSIKTTLIDGAIPRFKVDVVGKIDSTFGGIFGVSKLNVDAAASVPILVPKLEVALVLDNTGSMNGQGKLSELKDAATSLVSILTDSSSKYAADAKIAIVPFAKDVNIGKSNASQSWLDWSGYSGNASSWPGCVTDRNQPFDVNNSSPTVDSNTWFPASSCSVEEILPLTSNEASLNGKIKSMKATGMTNVTIGVNWGYFMLTPGAPLSKAAAASKNLTRYMIVLTDGWNTKNRWTSDPVQIDARLSQACTNAKAAGIKIFTIRVIEGNEPVLKACASSASMYHNISKASELKAVFEAIARKMTTSIYLGT